MTFAVVRAWREEAALMRADCRQDGERSQSDHHVNRSWQHVLDSATGRVFLSYLPRQQLLPRLQLEINRAATSGISWPDLNPDLGSVEALTKKIRRERIAYVDGRYIPGLIAISSAITNWQEEIEVAITLFGTHREMLEPNSSARTALVDFASRHSIVAPARVSHGRAQ
jgi:DNA-binding IclR family transcriptional regulator